MLCLHPRLPTLVLLTAGSLQAGLSPAETKLFENEIRPLLAEHCYQCHSQDAKNLKGGLLLDSAPGWQNGGDSGEVIVPGDPEASRLIHAVRYTDRDLQMPPKYRLADDEVAALEKWIALGAPDPRETETAPVLAEIDLEKGRSYWAFQKPRRTAGTTSIDAFINEKLADAGLEPAARAGRTTLIRRASFDLTGLPPTPEQIDAFVEDPRSDDDAFAALVDELLATKAFGERWGRHWLDIVRYAESMGRTRNYPFPYAWRYRDYVIDAFNTDIPYDAFVREQLAGDLLPAENDAERDRLHVATGFLALGSMDLNERDREQYRMDVVDEQIDVTGRAILALTTGCARCHDHKFDPIPQADYYALAGIFRSTETFSGYHNRQGGNRPGFTPELLITLDSEPAEVVAQEEQTVDPKLQQRLKKQQRQLAQVNRQIRQASKRPQAKRAGKQITAEKPGVSLAKLRARKKTLQRALAKTRQALNANTKEKGERPKVPRTANYAMGARDIGKPEDCRINVRGEARNLGDQVPRGFLRVLSAENESILEKPAQSGRLELARWLTSPENPLTARVLVNRLWHHLLGHGLVRTVDNFGAMGEPPTHPALLDHLAIRFVEHGWSVKKMIREIMLSEVYRRDSTHDAGAHDRDPENRLLWRAHVRRLQAEPLRDALLSVSGRLNAESPPGSPVMYRPFKDLRRATGALDDDWRTRRSVYLPILRGFVPPFFQIFDFAEPSQVMGRRDVTTVSTQALFFMNNAFLMEQARHAAGRLLASEIKPGQRLAKAYRLCLGRRPTREEVAASKAFLRASGAGKPRERWAGLFQALFASAEFRYLR